VRDLGSENGTLLNGEPLDGERTLRNGDELELGESVVRLVHTEPVGLSVPYVKTRKPRPSLPRPLVIAAGVGALAAAWFVFGATPRSQTPRPPEAPAAAPEGPAPVVTKLPVPAVPSDAPPAAAAVEPAPRPHHAATASSFAVAVAKGDALAAADPSAALAAYQAALTLDESSGGGHAALLRAKIARTAVPAATAFVAGGKFEQARAACDIAERAGADVTRVRTSLEAAAARLFADARTHPGPDAQALYRRILRIVPPSSQWHEKALAQLGEAP